MPAKMSVATIDSPEFLNISSINPLISKCEIKVLYIGENRNMSYITKEVATEMAATLPGTPIVGHYVESKEDFGDHGQQVIIDDEGIKFNTLTTPYGFVAPDAKIWFQKFEDTDDFGNTVVREYLMTEGYLWTGQFEECKRVLDYGNPQSMELDEKTLKGYWSEDINRGVEFFIINDAIFSKLCILGEDVEPCFSGASVTAPEVSTKFSKNESFNKTLYTMMQELNSALKGESEMENEQIVEEVTEVVAETEFSENSQDNVVEENIVENQETIEEASEDTAEESPASEENAEVVVEETAEPVEATETEAPAETETEFSKKEEDEEEKPEEEKEEVEESKEEDDEEKKKYALLEQKYNDLEANYSALEAKYQEVLEYKNKMEEKQKDELISTFSMLTEEEMKEVVSNKAQYSLEEIESKLSIIYARKQRTLAKAEEEKVEAPVVYTIQEDLSSNPDWVNEVLNTQKTM